MFIVCCLECQIYKMEMDEDGDGYQKRRSQAMNVYPPYQFFDTTLSLATTVPSRTNPEFKYEGVMRCFCRATITERGCGRGGNVNGEGRIAWGVGRSEW